MPPATSPATVKRDWLVDGAGDYTQLEHCGGCKVKVLTYHIWYDRLSTSTVWWYYLCDACSDANPNRGGIAEVSLRAG